MPHTTQQVSVIKGCGSYLPEKVLTNHDLEKMVETDDAWIVSRTGISKRHIAADGQLTSDMAAKAAAEAMKAAGVSPEEVDLIVLATTTPDNTFPSTATKVQHLLQIKQGAAFDVQAVCAGFIYALSVADNFIKAGQVRTAIVIGADSMSRIVDWKDRGTCILFGDGAGAVVLKAEEAGSGPHGILSTHLYSDGSFMDALYVDGGVALNGRAGTVKMAGQEVFKHAVEKMSDVVIEALEHNGLAVRDVDVMIPHQANIRIIEAVARRLGVPKERVVRTVEVHANTSAASIPLALTEAVKTGKIQPGGLVAMQAIGGGLCWGAALVRW